MIDYDFTTTTPLTTTVELRAWAVAATAACASRGHAPRFLLSPTQRLAKEEWRLETRERMGLNRSIGGALLAVLRRDWPTSGRTGGRTHLTALGVVRLVAGARAAREDAAAADAEAERHEREESRVRRLDEAIEAAFPGLSDASFAARWGWRDRPHHGLGGRTPVELARNSAGGLEAALAVLRPLIADREVRESAGWDLQVRPEEAARLDWWPEEGGAGRVVVPEGKAIAAHLYQDGRHVGLVRFHGLRGHSEAVIGRHCRIAWLLDDAEAAAAQAGLSAAAAAFLRIRGAPRPFGVPDRTPLEAFLTGHLLPLGRRAALSGLEDPTQGIGGAAS